MNAEQPDPKDFTSRRISVFGGVYQSWQACPAYVLRPNIDPKTLATCRSCMWRWDIFCRRTTWGWIVPPPATDTNHNPK